MSGGLVFASIAERSGALVVLDEGRRLYAGLSHEATYWHVIQPSQLEMRDLESGELTRAVGDLVCTCKGFTFHGHCYRTTEAIEHERRLADADAAPRWLREVAPETELERAAARG